MHPEKKWKTANYCVKFSNTLYKIQALEGDVVLIPPKYFDELKVMPDSHLDFAQGQEIVIIPSISLSLITDSLKTVVDEQVYEDTGNGLGDDFDEK